MSTKLVATDVDPDRGVMLRLDFTHTQIHRTASFPFSLPHTEAHVRYDLVALSGTIRSCGFILYDINLGATATTILRIRGVQIPIDLVSSATDSYRRNVVLFKLLSIPTSDLKSEFLYQSSSIVRSLQTSPLNHLVRLGYLPRPRHHVSPVLPQPKCSHRVPQAEAPFTTG